MTAKKTFTLSVRRDLLEAFYAQCGLYGHSKEKGMIMGAAMLMFIEADPELQKACIKRVLIADVDQHAADVAAAARLEQARKIQARESQQAGPGKHLA